ncbi:MAG: hypothetical protein LBM28_01110 [Oscillospiraceae bacterium]|jgi:penicillin-binding protein 2|nr:hypothetical protein [Oscillospiraceae bacterium]
MNQHKFSFRVGTVVALLVLLSSVFVARLFDLQITQAGQEDSAPSGSITYNTRVTAARGEILDRNGNVLIGNRASYNLVIINDVFFSADAPNENMRRLLNLCNSMGLEITDHFPVTKEKPYEYTTDSFSSTWNGYFKTFLEARGWDVDISAAQLVRRLKEKYNIPADWSEEEARRVVSLRYELDLRRYTSLPTYTLLNDVDAVSLAAVTELNIPGLNVETSTVRQYNTDYAAHILGRIAQMNPEQYEKYKLEGYAMDALVGQDGLELAFESSLHGTDGTRVTTVAADGTILEEHYAKEPIAGDSIELTIDINLQKIAEDKLEEVILDLRKDGVNEKGEGKDAEGGAVVAMLVNSGEVLVSASYPTYNISTYAEDFNTLLETDFAPMYNRAFEAYPPGSTFKMVTTVAAVDSGTVGRFYALEDKGIYTRFEDVDYTPRCLTYTNFGTTHGRINVMQALAVSCNYYFYEVGYLTGISKIDATAKALGLGEATGIELPESVGRRANAETKKALYDEGYDDWYDADTVGTSIGQSENRFTPIQLCSYTASLANGGTRYKATFLRRVISPDYREIILQNEPLVASKLNISDEAYKAYSEGMRLAVTSGSGTANAVFGDYDIAVCAKTGTAEHGSGGSANAAFVLYAPAENPEIAIAVYVEKGAQGGNLGKVAMAILDAYFSQEGKIDTMPGENILN